MTDSTSRQRGHPTETRQQLSENNLRTEWARYLDILTDRLSVVTLLRLRQKYSTRFNKPNWSDMQGNKLGLLYMIFPSCCLEGQKIDY
jgi:hypothetical protein